MVRSSLLAGLVGAGCWLFWYPLIMAQYLYPPWWLPFPLIAALVAVGTILSRERAVGVVVAAVAGTFAGTASGFAIWKSEDGIVASYNGLTIALETLATLVVAVLTFLLFGKRAAWMERQTRSLWLTLVFCAAVGPLALAVTPPILGYRISSNDRDAALRFESLKQAVEQTLSDGGSRLSICDGKNLQKRYVGPPFRDEAWTYITGNAVKQSGYVFTVHCMEMDGYVIDAQPSRSDLDGTRHFCTDESHAVGCMAEWNRSRYQCVPCSK
jgi:hypothetical protein